MKAYTFLFAALLFSITSFAQDITGSWNGVLKVQGIQLRLTFHVEKTEKGYSSSMDSPDQNAYGIPATSTSFNDNTLQIGIAAAGIEYAGVLEADEKIKGTFKQGGMNLPLDLSREAFIKVEQKRPQEPREPYPYLSEDLFFHNEKAGIKLAGTLTTPQEGSNFPAVILISGSGAQNRDEEIMGHKPFLVLADYLTRNGIAVLRYDDRGTAESEGNFMNATSADFATDVQAAVDFLKTRNEINPSQIGLIGHSEGGLIAPMVASSDEDVAFIVLLAGTGVRGDKILLAQQALIGEVSGMTTAQLKENDLISRGAFEIVVKEQSEEQLKNELTEYMTKVFRNIPKENLPPNMTESDFVVAQTSQLSNPWMKYFINYDPAPALEKVSCPVLAINGAKDLQVPAKENLAAIKHALEKGGNPNITTVELPGLNHLFQEADTGAPSEYGEIEQTFSPDAMKLISEWIIEQVRP